MNDNLTFEQELELAKAADAERAALAAQLAAQKAEEEQARLAAMEKQASADYKQQIEDDSWYAAHYEVREIEPQYLQAKQDLDQAKALLTKAYSDIRNATLGARTQEVNAVYARVFELNNQVTSYAQNAEFKFVDYKNYKTKIEKALSDIAAGLIQPWNIPSLEQTIGNLTRFIDEILDIYPFMASMDSAAQARSTAQAELDAGVVDSQLMLNEAQREVDYLMSLSDEQMALRYNRPDLNDAVPVALANLQLAQSNFDNLQTSYNLAVERQAGQLREVDKATRDAIEAAQAAERARLAYEREQIESAELGQRLLQAEQNAAQARLAAQAAEQEMQRQLQIQAEQEKAAQAAAYLREQEAAAAAKAAAEAERARMIAEQARAEEARIAEAARQQAAAEAQRAQQEALIAQQREQQAAAQAAAAAQEAQTQAEQAAMQALIQRQETQVMPTGKPIETMPDLFGAISTGPEWEEYLKSVGGDLTPKAPGNTVEIVNSPDANIDVLVPAGGTGDANMPSFNLFPNDELAAMSVSDKVEHYFELKRQGISDEEIIAAYAIPPADWEALMEAVRLVRIDALINPVIGTGTDIQTTQPANAGLLLAAGIAALTLLG